MVLSQVAGVYDPIGIAVPYILTAKVLMRTLCQENSNSNEEWDKPLSDEMRQSWVEFFIGLFELETLGIPRCIQPIKIIGSPMLILFSDGSNLAFGACAYIRWKVDSDTYDATLVMSKNRIAPTKQLSIPRIELCGAVLSARMREKIVNSMTFDFERIIHVVDSAIVRAQIQKDSYGFGTFVANRVAEIQTKTKKSEWFWVPGDQNPADLTTRITQVSELSKESVWQKGPAFLCMPVEKWPIRQDCDVVDIPDVKVHHADIQVELKENIRLDVLKLIDTKRISSLKKLYCVTSILQMIAEKRSFKGIVSQTSVESLKKAEHLWIKYAQLDLPSDTMYRFRRLEAQSSVEGIITVGQRMNKWLENTWNTTSFSLLPADHIFTEFIVKAVHDEDHAVFPH